MAASAASAFDHHAAKRALIDTLESSRHAAPGRPRAEASAAVDDARKSGLIAEVERLRAETARARADDAVLEEGLRQMEDRALAAIREAGALKTRCQKLQIQAAGDQAAENTRLALRLQGKEEENRLLTEALAASENEIARLSQMLAKVMEKLA